MNLSTRVRANRLVLSPHDSLVAGGPAGEFETSVQGLFKAGYRHFVADLRGVPSMDSSGVRALVRCLTTSQRLEGSFSLVAPNAEVRAVLEAARLDSVFPVFDTLEPALARRWPWKQLRLAGVGALLVVALLAIGSWPGTGNGSPGFLSQERGARELTLTHGPLGALARLLTAAAIGALVTAVRRWQRRGPLQTRSMEQAQVLLCVAGAMMMIIIGDSVARAFGIAGAAAIIRFRTPVENPEDITVLFLLMGLGMSAGLGAFDVAGVATAFLCVLLLVLDHTQAPRSRAMMIEVEANGREFPSAHVQRAFARCGVVFEPREVSQGKNVAIRYLATLEPNQSLEELSEQLVSDGNAGVKSVSWESARRGDA